jgi:DNA-binding Lrp family transcriptional regulator
MNDETLSRLRAAGGLIGETNLASWDELVATFQDTGVAFGIANAKREFECRSVTATQCAKALRHKLRSLEPARKAGEPLVVRAADAPPLPAPPLRKSATSALVTSTVEESAPTAAKVVQMPGDGNPTKRVDYRAIVQKLGRFRLAELARAAGVRPQSARLAVRKLEAEGVIEREEAGNCRSPFRVVGLGAEPAADAGERERGGATVSADREPVNEAAETVNAAAAEPLTKAEQDGLDIALGVADFGAAAAKAIKAVELDTGEDLRARLPRTPVATSSPDDVALAVTHADLSGPFRPLLVRFLDAFAARRGFAYTVEQLGTCQDLVAVRR